MNIVTPTNMERMRVMLTNTPINMHMDIPMRSPMDISMNTQAIMEHMSIST